MNKFLSFFVFCFLFIINSYAQTPDGNGILYVKAGGGGDGSSWANALGEVADALKAAKTLPAGTVKEIWVAGGTWYPLYAADFASTDDRDKAFVMVNNVNLYGGFAGTETALSDRDLSLTANKTILSGDLGTKNIYTDNAYHVMVAAGAVGTAKLDGFTLSYGSSSDNSSIASLAVNGNAVYRYVGGGMIVLNAGPVISNVIFSGNSALAGGGIYILSGSNAVLTNCVISGNVVSASGGGAFIYNATVVFTNVTVAGNNATGGLAAIFFSIGGNGTIRNSIIYGNSSGISSMGTYTIDYSMDQGSSGNPANHVLPGADPLFANSPAYTSAPFTSGNYALGSGSPVADQGSNSLFTGLSASSKDIIGSPRVSNYTGGGIIDMGAYEYKVPLSQTITVADAVKTYGDPDFEPVASASSGLAVTLQSSDVTIANPYIDVADGNKWKIKILKAGVVTITASQAGNSDYASAPNKTFTVTVNKAALTVTADDDSKTYDGVGYNGGNGVSYNGFVNSENAGVLTGTLVYSGSSQGAVNVGTYVVSPSGLSAANYTITYVDGSLNIGKAALMVTANNATKNYDGVIYSGGNGVSYSGFVNSENAGVLTGTLSYNGSSQGAVNVGSYVITPSGLTAANYSITYVDGSLSIGKVALMVKANDDSKTYDGMIYGGGNGVSYSGFVNSENAGVLTGTLVYSGTSQGAVNAGNYVISTSGLTALNYSITYVAGNLNISKVALTVTADNATKTYDGVGYSGGNGVSYSGFVNSENAGVLTGTLAYSGSSQGAVNVGTYVISPSGLSAANYSITYVDGSLNIGKAALMVTATNATKIYNGVSYIGGNGVSYSGFVNSESAGVLTGSLIYSGNSQGAVNVGNYVISPSGLTAANYSITYVDGSLSIGKASLTVTADDATKTYDGVSYSGGNGVSYSGFVNSENGSVLTGTLVYSGTSQGAVNAGNYVISPSGLTALNYSIAYIVGNLNISKAALTVTADNAIKTYDGLGYSGGNGVSYSGFVNSENAAVLTGTLTYSGSSQGAVNVGGYVISPSGLSAANYTITYVDGSLNIGKAALTVKANNATKTYDGGSYSGGNGVSYSGFVNSENAGVLTGTLTYSGSSQGAVNVGSYVVSPSGLSAVNYAITYVDGSLSIDKAALTVTADDAAKTYDGVSYSGGNGVSYSGFVNSENAGVLTGTLIYSGSSQGAVNAGSYVISPSGLSAANYIITYVDGNLSISKSSLTVAANNATKTYDGMSYSGGNGVSYSGFVNSENAGVLTGTLTYSGSSQGAVNVGNYVISPSGLSALNYSITYVDGSLSIGKALLTVMAADAAKTYDGVSYSGGNGVSYNGFVNSENASVLSGTLTYSGSSQGAMNVGSYVISPSGLSAFNYSITYVDGNLSIGKAALTVTASNATKTYDGLSYSGGNGVSYGGFVNSENASVLTGTLSYNGSSQGSVNVGTYVISPSGLSAANYSITYVDGSLSIDKAALTVTANNATKIYDGVGYSGGNGVSYSGFVNSENAGVLIGTLTYSGSSQGAVNTGSYVITLSGLSAANYAVTYVDGSLSIGKAALTVTANNATKTYDGVSYSGGNGVSYSGFVNSENAGVLTGTLIYGGSSQGAVNVGNYVMAVSGLSAANYTITYVDGSLSIGKAALIVKAIDKSKTYDGVSYSGGNGVSFNGFVNGENAGVLTGTLTYSGSSQGAVNVGQYNIIPAGYSSNNYTISYTNGTLIIDKAALTITADNQARCAGIVNPTFTISYSGWVSGEGISTLSTAATVSSGATALSPAGTYTIIPAGAVADNYTITYVNGALTIYPLPVVTLTASNGAVLCGNNASITLTASGNYTYQWLQDNSIINGMNTSTITISAIGKYTAIATDGNGCTANADNSITVTRLLPATVAFDYDSYCAGKAVSFTNTSDISKSSNVTYTWLSGDGQTRNSKNAGFTYGTAGSYVVSLSIAPVACPSLAVTTTQQINIAAQVEGVRLPTVTTKTGLATQLTARELVGADYTWTPATGLSDAGIYNPVATLYESQEYQIEMNFASGCSTIDTLLVSPFVSYDIITPNAFTPNGDGQNDVFKVHLRGIKQFNYLVIYDRWGNKIFESKDAAIGWDGKFAGALTGVGTYIWMAAGIDMDGRTIQRQGVVTLIR